MSKKLTRWFPAEVKPFHKGLYNAGHWRMADSFFVWDGKYWRFSKEVDGLAGQKCFSQNKQWRGLAEKP